MNTFKTIIVLTFFLLLISIGNCAYSSGKKIIDNNNLRINNTYNLLRGE